MSDFNQIRRLGRWGRRTAVALVLGLGATQLWACADYKAFRAPDNSGIQEGPGLFTGSEGEWVLFRKQDEANQEEAGEDRDEKVK